MTIYEIIQQINKDFESAGLYYGHGTDSAWDEAVMLVLTVLKLSMDMTEEPADQSITAEQEEKILSLARRRIAKRVPLPYLLKCAYFAGLPFYVDERVIIPRSPFAELIENEFQPWVKPERVKNILDLCTGSGCMAIASALAFPKVQVDAVELSKEALEVAHINVEKFEVNDRVNLIQGDLWENVPDKKYDLIISNPPYVSDAEIETLPTEFKHEPQIALQADDDGLKIVLEIIKHAKEHLNKEGVLIVEVGNSQEALEKRLPHLPFIWLEFERGGQGVFLLTAEEL